jgi:putative membrane protein insertion efficiency factor
MKRSFLSGALLKSIDFYRRSISPYKGGPCCRYVPTCSTYAREAIQRYGAVKGARLAAWRLARCNPWSKGGYDPVPEDPCTTFRKQ